MDRTRPPASSITNYHDARDPRAGEGPQIILPIRVGAGADPHGGRRQAMIYFAEPAVSGRRGLRHPRAAQNRKGRGDQGAGL